MLLIIIIITTLLIDEARNQTKPGNNSNQVVVFGERGKLEYPGKKNVLEQRTNRLSPHIA